MYGPTQRKEDPDTVVPSSSSKLGYRALVPLKKVLIPSHKVGFAGLDDRALILLKKAFMSSHEANTTTGY